MAYKVVNWMIENEGAVTIACYGIGFCFFAAPVLLYVGEILEALRKLLS